MVRLTLCMGRKRYISYISLELQFLYTGDIAFCRYSLVRYAWQWVWLLYCALFCIALSCCVFSPVLLHCYLSSPSFLILLFLHSHHVRVFSFLFRSSAQLYSLTLSVVCLSPSLFPSVCVSRKDWKRPPPIYIVSCRFVHCRIHRSKLRIVARRPQ